MNIALLWIKAYVPDLDITARDYTDAMTLTGTKVEGYICPGKNLEKIVVGEILEIEGHPGADKLVMCQVNVETEEPVQIVIGVPNITEKSIGEKVPVVLDGGRVARDHDGGALPEKGIRTKWDKLRGVEPCSMTCSAGELGASRDIYPDASENDIYILPGGSMPGSDTVEIMGLRGMVFECETTSNHMDCYSVIGIAKEAAAIFGGASHVPVVIPAGNDENIYDYLNVRVENSELCPRYYTRMVKNIKLASSPQWMQRCLTGNGIRLTNNIVDITNYVVEEYGQPMHAFDHNQLAGREIVAKCAKSRDISQTLDGQERKLDSIVLMINGGKEEVGIAGIMGGENFKITDNVQTMVFEPTCFNGTNIRLSAEKVGPRTDASGKYEKGLDPNTAEEAINRACQLIEGLGVEEAAGDIIDLYFEKRTNKRVPFDAAKINRFLGADIPEEIMLSYFKTIELDYGPETKEVIAPTWRQDLECMADLVKEVARFYGYDRTPTTLPSGGTATGKFSYKLQMEEVAKEIAEFHGFSQGMAYSFEGPEVFDRVLILEDSAPRKIVEISSPLGGDFSVMRITSLSGVLTPLPANYNRRNKDVRLYKLANAYRPKSLPLTELPDERMQLTLRMCGNGDLFTMKGVVEEFSEKTGMHKKPYYDPSAEHPYLHPGRKADILYDGAAVGFLGGVHPDVADNYKTGGRAYIAVADMSSIMDFATSNRRYTGIVRFPAMIRNISMVVPRDILVGQIEDVIEQRGGKVPESYKLFDVYEEVQVLTGHESVACSITLRAKDRILEEKEVTSVMSKILNGLDGLGIEPKA